VEVGQLGLATHEWGIQTRGGGAVRLGAKAIALLTHRLNKCLCKINFILPSKILNHPFHIIDEIAPAVVGGEVNPFVLHNLPFAQI
jgi:hypothetical protein